MKSKTKARHPDRSFSQYLRKNDIPSWKYHPDSWCNFQIPITVNCIACNHCQKMKLGGRTTWWNFAFKLISGANCTEGSNVNRTVARFTKFSRSPTRFIDEPKRVFILKYDFDDIRETKKSSLIWIYLVQWQYHSKIKCRNNLID